MEVFRYKGLPNIILWNEEKQTVFFSLKISLEIPLEGVFWEGGGILGGGRQTGLFPGTRV